MMSVTTTYFRHQAEESQEFDDVDAAVRFLAWGEDSGTLSSRHSVVTDGERVIEGRELEALVDAVWDARV